MLAYKAPRLIEYVQRLPRSAARKIAWRELQEKEMHGAQLTNLNA